MENNKAINGSGLATLFQLIRGYVDTQDQSILGEIENLRFTTGKGLELKDGVLSVTLDTSLFTVVTELPEAPEVGKEDKIYLVPSAETGEDNTYTEYIFMHNEEGDTYTPEELGKFKADVDLTSYIRFDDLATAEKAGAMSKEDKAKLDSVEENAEVNKIESVLVNGTALEVNHKRVDILSSDSIIFSLSKDVSTPGILADIKVNPSKDNLIQVDGNGLMVDGSLIKEGFETFHIWWDYYKAEFDSVKEEFKDSCMQKNLALVKDLYDKAKKLSEDTGEGEDIPYTIPVKIVSNLYHENSSDETYFGQLEVKYDSSDEIYVMLYIHDNEEKGFIGRAWFIYNVSENSLELNKVSEPCYDEQRSELYLKEFLELGGLNIGDCLAYPNKVDASWDIGIESTANNLNGHTDLGNGEYLSGIWGIYGYPDKVRFDPGTLGDLDVRDILYLKKFELTEDSQNNPTWCSIPIDGKQNVLTYNEETNVLSFMWDMPVVDIPKVDLGVTGLMTGATQEGFPFYRSYRGIMWGQARKELSTDYQDLNLDLLGENGTKDTLILWRLESATMNTAGLMSANDKNRLDQLRNYTLPAATADTLGGVKVPAYYASMGQNFSNELQIIDDGSVFLRLGLYYDPEKNIIQLQNLKKGAVVDIVSSIDCNQIIEKAIYDDTAVKTSITQLETNLNTLLNSNPDTAINNFNEIVAFLAGIEDSETLEGVLAGISQQIAEKANDADVIKEIRVNHVSYTPSSVGVIELPLAMSAGSDGIGKRDGMFPGEYMDAVKHWYMLNPRRNHLLLDAKFTTTSEQVTLHLMRANLDEASYYPEETYLPLATTDKAGAMSAADKTKLDELENYDDTEVKEDISSLQTKVESLEMNGVEYMTEEEVTEIFNSVFNS